MNGCGVGAVSRRVPLAALALVVLLERQAAAERLAVLVLSATPRESSLAENLSEVAIARLAEVPGRQLIGGLEIKKRITTEGDLSICLIDPSCVARVGGVLNVNRAVIGVVRSKGGRCLLNVALTNVASGVVENRIVKETEEGVSSAIAATQAAVEELFRSPAPAARLRVRAQKDGARVVLDDVVLGTTPLLAGPIAPGSRRLRVELDGHFSWRSTVNLTPGQELSLNLGSRELVQRRRWAAPVAYGAVATAVLAFASGGVLGTMGSADLNGQTRAEVQQDLRRKERYVTAGNGLFGVGIVLSATSAFVFGRYWRDIRSE